MFILKRVTDGQPPSNLYKDKELIPSFNSAADIDHDSIGVIIECDVQGVSYSGFKYEFGTDEV